jgi:hypothetical protein
VYDREFDGKERHFGVIGVDEGTLIMYDHETESYWSQLVGEAVSGDMKGTRLQKFPSTMTTWGQWKELHPETTVYVKRSVPYNSRFTKATFAKVAAMEPGPVRSNDLVVGLEGHVHARAYLVRRLARDRLVEERFEGAPIAVYLSEDLSTARVFERTVEGRALSLTLTDGEELVDAETGTRWNPVSGEAVSGPLQGKKLQSLISTYSVWFAWEHYRPDTSVHGESE